MGTGPTVGKSAIHWSTFFGEQFDSIFLTKKSIFIDLEFPVSRCSHVCTVMHEGVGCSGSGFVNYGTPTQQNFVQL